ncbi:MAG TPA: polyhydroxyalkanoate synthesis regulator DNA-binding domain-containing protein [Anaerolineae bacterium]|nr:polyhydroxyalkanoate synthesis regulator DNA-binding domain-containing protein [Anaerolineae bacterium]
MPLIKRYPNRKLYDTEAKRYITLEGISALIREGEEVRVVDHTSGEDLTAVTLTQVILEQEKKRGGFLPQTVLAGLIQAGGERMSTLRHALASPLELARHVDEEIERRLEALMSHGELAAEEVVRLRDQLLGQGARLSSAWRPSDEDVQRVLIERGVPSHDDLQQIIDQLEALANKLDEMTPDGESSRVL